MSLETFFDSLPEGQPDPGVLDRLLQPEPGWTQERLELPEGAILRQTGPEGRELTFWLGPEDRIRLGTWARWDQDPPQLGLFSVKQDKLVVETAYDEPRELPLGFSPAAWKLPLPTPKPETILCPGCEQPQPAGGSFCGDCGQSLVALASAPFCTQCGQRLRSAQSRFCNRCGHPVADDQ